MFAIEEGLGNKLRKIFGDSFFERLRKGSPFAKAVKDMDSPLKKMAGEFTKDLPSFYKEAGLRNLTGKDKTNG